MDRSNDIAEFLRSRRAKVTPEQAGLPTNAKRRVPGLRREEVATLAGVSIDYYKRLERGNLSGVSESVLEALARALQLDDAERAHLFDIARTANPAAPKRRRPVAKQIRPAVQRVLDSITAPAIVRNSRLDYLGANQLGRALYAPTFDSRERQAAAPSARRRARPQLRSDGALRRYRPDHQRLRCGTRQPLTAGPGPSCQLDGHAGVAVRKRPHPRALTARLIRTSNRKRPPQR